VTVRCGFMTADGPCRNQAGSKRRCAAGHPCQVPVGAAAGAPTSGVDADPFASGRPPEPDVSLLLEHPALVDVFDRFDAAGVDIYVVGGPVRDLIDQGHPGADLDLCTPADVGTLKRLVGDLGAVPDTGQEYGTVKLFREGLPTVEITQFRGEAYHADSRKPDTVATTNLVEDLERRDLTVNAMALARDGSIVDPYGGRDDLAAGLLRTPGDPHRAFADDPLRIARVVRFASTRGWRPDADTVAAARATADRMGIVAAERRLVELNKILACDRPQALGEAVGLSRDLRVGRHLLGGMSDRAPRNASYAGLTSPKQRLAALAYPDPDASHDDMAALKMAKRDAAEAVAVARLAQAGTTATGTDARRLVRQADEAGMLDDAHQVSAAHHTTWTPDMHAAAADRDRLRAPLPVDGRDAIDRGLAGRDIGAWLARVEDAYLADPHRFGRADALKID
jgi:tRNA nucleotidyltransferase/poly(A) polymerase